MADRQTRRVAISCTKLNTTERLVKQARESNLRVNDLIDRAMDRHLGECDECSSLVTGLIKERQAMGNHIDVVTR